MARPQATIPGLFVAWCLLALASASHAEGDSTSGQLTGSVSFNLFGPYASYGELARRLMDSDAAARLEQRLLAAGTTLSGQPISLAAENFVVHVPAHKPEQGYGLLVFVPPWQQARLPPRWAQALDQHGVIFVSAARSGNDENPIGRRAPLALLAAHNIISRYSIDPQRVYIGGFSGGSRVALRLALGYPDLFRGAILNAGSDTIGDPAGDSPIPLPPLELLYEFQESSHIVYVTGERDSEHIADDLISMRSLHHWCVFGTDAIEIPRGEHEVADATTLSRAFDRLRDAQPPDPARLARCRADVESRLSTYPR